MLMAQLDGTMVTSKSQTIGKVTQVDECKKEGRFKIRISMFPSVETLPSSSIKLFFTCKTKSPDVEFKDVPDEFEYTTVYPIKIPSEVYSIENPYLMVSETPSKRSFNIFTT
jgi:hypothetical protein